MKNTQTLPSLLSNQAFQATVDKHSVELYTLRNKKGVCLQITNFGCRIVNLWTPDRHSDFANIVLGYSTINDYLSSKTPYYGALIGRYGNRIGKGRFNLDSKNYILPINNHSNHLHGGPEGFHNKVWQGTQPAENKLLFSRLSPDGEEGYPGNLQLKTSYELTDNNELKIEYWATTDQTTPINLTHHSYFNLTGASKGGIDQHSLKINADCFIPVDKELIPTGEITSVANTPMDFRTAKNIGKDINQPYPQIKLCGGFDHTWVLNDSPVAAKVLDPISGRTLTVQTNEPGIQFYNDNFDAFCLETQHYPDSPNQPDFPSSILKPGDEYYSVCIYGFGVELSD